MRNRQSFEVLVNMNIKLINYYFERLEQEQIEQLFVKMDDILFFYGFEKEELLQILKKRRLKASECFNLSELYGLTNAFVFQLKYKMNLDLGPGTAKEVNINSSGDSAA